MPDYNLKQSLAKLNATPFSFALIEGKNSDMVLVTPKPATGKLLDDTKEECGDGKRVARGICLWENGKLVFVTPKPPMPSWKSVLKKIFEEQKCSLFLPIKLRQRANGESNDSESDDDNDS
jgi:hypothetical protein